MNRTEMLDSYLQKAAGQLACARDQARELVPKPVEMVTRLASMVAEVERLQKEVAEYSDRNSACKPSTQQQLEHIQEVIDTGGL